MDRKIAMPQMGGVGSLCCFLRQGLSVKPIFRAHGYKTRIKNYCRKQGCEKQI